MAVSACQPRPTSRIVRDPPSAIGAVVRCGEDCVPAATAIAATDAAPIAPRLRIVRLPALGTRVAIPQPPSCASTLATAGKAVKSTRLHSPSVDDGIAFDSFEEAKAVEAPRQGGT